MNNVKSMYIECKLYLLN